MKLLFQLALGVSLKDNDNFSFNKSTKQDEDKSDIDLF